MPRLVIRIALLGVIASAVACSEDPELGKLEALKKEVCACTTAECGDAAMKQLPAVGAGRAQPSTYREQAAAHAIVNCLAKLYEQDRPKAEPPVDDSDDTQAAAGSANPTLPAGSATSP
ncbi:MAG TPA: hypothetical protein VGM39_13205 [Kofleriaceae bacterium]